MIHTLSHVACWLALTFVLIIAVHKVAPKTRLASGDVTWTHLKNRDAKLQHMLLVLLFQLKIRTNTTVKDLRPQDVVVCTDAYARCSDWRYIAGEIWSDYGRVLYINNDAFTTDHHYFMANILLVNFVFPQVPIHDVVARLFADKTCVARLSEYARQIDSKFVHTK